MTFSTCRLSVLTKQWKFRPIVVERDKRPRLDVVTAVAICATAGDRFLAAFVWIPVARLAVAFLKSELEPRRCRALAVTAVARYGEVRALKRIPGRLVLLECELGRPETLHAMAFFASPGGLARRKLPAMIVLMASAALIELESGERLPRLVALFADQGCVLSQQGEFRAAVIEIGAVARLPALCRMTAGAVDTELPLVGIAMTVGASLMSDSGQLRKCGIGSVGDVPPRLVAFFARQSLMLPAQNEFGAVVIKTYQRFPAGH